MDQLATKLDQWLYAIAKMDKLTNPVPLDYKFVIFKQLIPKHLEDVIETNKQDLGNYSDVLKYVQAQLRKHQEKAQPTPMDVGNLDQYDEDNEEQQHKHKQQYEK